MLLNNTIQDIKDMLKAHGKSQRSIAKEIDVSPQMISKFLNNEDSPHVSKTLIKIADALGYDIEIRYVAKGDKK